MLTNARTFSVILGVFLLHLGIATQHSHGLPDVPMRGVLVTYSIVGGLIALISAVVYDKEDASKLRLTSLGILISYGLYRAITFTVRAFQTTDGFIEAVQHLNFSAVWAFIIFLSLVILTLFKEKHGY